MSDRYEASGIESQFEPGSNGQVLANELGVVDPREMDDLESSLLQDLYESILWRNFPDRCLTAADLKNWHRQWLGNVYSWAGGERSVNISKDGFHFAAAAQVSRLLAQFEEQYLGRYTPCHAVDEAALLDAISVTHVELILIHPFREGNGRLSRLLADVMAVQAGRSPMDYSAWEAHREGYFAAIQHGMAGDYGPMRSYVRQALLGLGPQ